MICMCECGNEQFQSLVRIKRLIERSMNLRLQANRLLQGIVDVGLNSRVTFSCNASCWSYVSPNYIAEIAINCGPRVRSSLGLEIVLDHARRVEGEGFGRVCLSWLDTLSLV